MTTTSPANEKVEAMTAIPTEESPRKEDGAKPDETAPPPKKEEHKNIGNFTVGKYLVSSLSNDTLHIRTGHGGRGGTVPVPTGAT